MSVFTSQTGSHRLPMPKSLFVAMAAVPIVIAAALPTPASARVRIEVVLGACDRTPGCTYKMLSDGTLRGCSAHACFDCGPDRWCYGGKTTKNPKGTTAGPKTKGSDPVSNLMRGSSKAPVYGLPKPVKQTNAGQSPAQGLPQSAAKPKVTLQDKNNPKQESSSTQRR